MPFFHLLRGNKPGSRSFARTDRSPGPRMVVQRDPAGEVVPEGPHAGSGAGVTAQQGHRDPQPVRGPARVGIQKKVLTDFRVEPVSRVTNETILYIFQSSLEGSPPHRFSFGGLS